MLTVESAYCRVVMIWKMTLKELMAWVLRQQVDMLPGALV